MHLYVEVQVIEHKHQRYDTAGDWQVARQGEGADQLIVTVSDTGDPRMNVLLAHHEVTEGMLCYYAGVTQRKVDDFDKNFEQARQAAIEQNQTEFTFRGETGLDVGSAEPGDHPEAPYYQEHQLATAFERAMAVTLGVEWLAYERRLGALVWRE
jgi:Tat protein secretion system quality control protein TatD with DNase activity